MELKDLIPIVISVASFLFTAYMTIKYQSLDAKVKKLELEKYRQAEEDSRKADIVVSVIPGVREANCLIFTNKGCCEAENISFDILSDTEDEIALRIKDDYLPYPKLLHDQSFEVYYYDFSDKPHHTVAITWDDQFGKCRRKEMVIDL